MHLSQEANGQLNFVGLDQSWIWANGQTPRKAFACMESYSRL